MAGSIRLPAEGAPKPAIDRSILRIGGIPRMTAENFENTLNALRQIQPFRVFTVELHGGRRFEVDHPEAMIVRYGVAVFIAPGGIPVWFDHDRVVQIVGASASTPLSEVGEADLPR